ncbi:hypothetical protein B484DRAFT_405997 [Ochromonadaceae sp. CCMP2298]|nr:hypothetical protein B484DRAFT_405997 [Ochromonadaceae sp. CCMP2298]
MSFTFAGVLRTCAYMISNDSERVAKLGYCTKPGAPGVEDNYKAQLQGTCFTEAGQLRNEFQPKAPIIRTFRKNVDRYAENGIILMNYTKPPEWQENVNDPPETREFGYLLDKFEELRSNPLERSEQVATDPPTDFVSGLSITSNAKWSLTRINWKN